MIERRHVIVSIPEEMLVDVLTGAIGITNIPADARRVSAWFDVVKIEGEDRRFMKIRLEHASFEVLRSGARIPELKLKGVRMPARKIARTDIQLALATATGA